MPNQLERKFQDSKISHHPNWFFEWGAGEERKARKFMNYGLCCYRHRKHDSIPLSFPTTQRRINVTAINCIRNLPSIRKQDKDKDKRQGKKKKKGRPEKNRKVQKMLTHLSLKGQTLLPGERQKSHCRFHFYTVRTWEFIPHSEMKDSRVQNLKKINEIQCRSYHYQ